MRWNGRKPGGEQSRPLSSCQIHLTIRSVNNNVHPSTVRLTKTDHPVDALAVVFERPEQLNLKRLPLVEPGGGDVVVDVEWTGISSGTERLLWTGRMPDFPGMGYPLVPGYETVGRVVRAGPDSGRVVGDQVFVAGARCFETTRSLFGGAAARLVVAGAKTVPLNPGLENQGILLALAATAFHAIEGGHGVQPDLIIGHGVLGRLLARLAVLLDDGRSVTVWETNPARHDGPQGYTVCSPSDDARRDYRAIYDVSGDAGIIDSLVDRLAPGGEIVLAGFYDRISFAFAKAFLREARLRVAAEWKPGDLETVASLAADGSLSLAGLITHSTPASSAASAYTRAFTDASCVKMVLDWRDCA